MRCDQVQERLSEYLEDLLDAESHTSVHDHLSSCPHCQAEAQALSQTRQAVADLPSVEPPPGFSQRVMSRIREEAERPSVWQRLFLPLRIKIPIHAMAILLVGGLAVYLYQANKPVQTGVAEFVPSEPQPSLEQGLNTQPPAASPSSPSELKSREMDETTSTAPGRRQDLKKEKNLADKGVGILQGEKENQLRAPGKISAQKIPVQIADYQLVVVPKDSTEKSTGLRQKVEELVKKMDGQPIQTEEVTAESKQNLDIEPQQDRPLKTETLWLIIPEDRYGQFKTELASLGKIQESSIAPEAPAGSMAAPKPSTEPHTHLRIKLILQPSKKQK